MPLDPSIRESLTSDYRNQDIAHVRGAYDYLNETALAPRMGIVCAYLSAVKATSVLDIGCGIGLLYRHVFPSMHYMGIDVSAAAVEAAVCLNGSSSRTNFRTHDLYTYLPERTYDAIVVMGFGLGMSYDEDITSSLRAIRQRYAPYLNPTGAFLVEAIHAYRPAIGKALVGDRIIAECQYECLDAEAHGSRSALVAELKA